MVKESFYIVGLSWLAGIIVALTWSLPHPLIWVEGLPVGLIIAMVGLVPLVTQRNSPKRFDIARRTVLCFGLVMFAIQYAGHNLL